MKLNQDTCHLLVSGHKNENVRANIGNEKIWKSNKQKLLGVDTDRNMNFNEHVSSLCRKMGNELSVLARLSNFMSFKQTYSFENFYRISVWILPSHMDVP